MREVLFRAKIKADNDAHKKGEWVYGHYCELIDGKKAIPCIYGSGEVCKNTIGQYTGLKDNTTWGKLTKEEQLEWLKNHSVEEWNGKKIFEGDIVDVLYDANYAGVAAERIGKFEVVFDRDCFMKRKIDGFGLFHFIASDVHTVIGNIHDNPELLKGE